MIAIHVRYCPPELGEENAERIGDARKSGDLEDLVQVANCSVLQPKSFATSSEAKMLELYEVIELPIDEVIEIFGLD